MSVTISGGAAGVKSIQRGRTSTNGRDLSIIIVTVKPEKCSLNILPCAFERNIKYSDLAISENEITGRYNGGAGSDLDVEWELIEYV